MENAIIEVTPKERIASFRRKKKLVKTVTPHEQGHGAKGGGYEVGPVNLQTDTERLQKLGVPCSIAVTESHDSGSS